MYEFLILTTCTCVKEYMYAYSCSSSSANSCLVFVRVRGTEEVLRRAPCKAAPATPDYTGKSQMRQGSLGNTNATRKRGCRHEVDVSAVLPECCRRMRAKTGAAVHSEGFLTPKGKHRFSAVKDGAPFLHGVSCNSSSSPGSSSAKRHRKMLRNNQGITKLAIRRLARGGGVKRIAGLIYETTRSVRKVVLHDAVNSSSSSSGGGGGDGGGSSTSKKQ